MQPIGRDPADLRGPRCETEDGKKETLLGPPEALRRKTKHLETNIWARRRAYVLASFQTLFVGPVHPLQEDGGPRLRVSWVGDSWSRLRTTHPNSLASLDCESSTSTVKPPTPTHRSTAVKLISCITCRLVNTLSLFHARLTCPFVSPGQPTKHAHVTVIKSFLWGSYLLPW